LLLEVICNYKNSKNLAVDEEQIKKQERGIPNPCFSSRLIQMMRDIL
jgi:hypothetical protein